MSATGQPIISLRNVDKTFENGTVALDSLNLDVRDGEFVSLLGPSGCGKSTVLRIIAGLSPTAAGSVTWPAGKARLGFVFQEPTLMPWADVAANVRLPIKLAQKQETGAVVNALGRVGLSPFAHSYPRELSGGMKMRVSIARALVTEPQLLLMDEPFAALDALTRRTMQQELLALWEQLRFTVLFVTHSIEEAIIVGSRILVLSPHPGRVRAELDAGNLDHNSIGTSEFGTLSKRIHHLLFSDGRKQQTPEEIRA